MKKENYSSLSVERFWVDLYQLQVDAEYIQLLIRSAETYSKVIKIILALLFNASLISLVITAYNIMDLPIWLWAAIIVFTHIVSVIASFFPYSDRVKIYPALHNRIVELRIEAEGLWPEIEGNHLSKEKNRSSKAGANGKQAKILYRCD